MTGSEIKTLDAAKAILERLEIKVDVLDARVQQLEISEARLLGATAATATATAKAVSDAATAAAKAVSDAAAAAARVNARGISVRGWLALGITAGLGLAGLFIRVAEIVTGS